MCKNNESDKKHSRDQQRSMPMFLAFTKVKSVVAYASLELFFTLRSDGDFFYVAQFIFSNE